MAALPFAIPDNVMDWIRDVFEQVNARSSATLSRIPTTWETTLDQGLIAHLRRLLGTVPVPIELGDQSRHPLP